MNASRKIAVLSSCVGWAVDYQDVPFSRRSICPIKKTDELSIFERYLKFFEFTFRD